MNETWHRNAFIYGIDVARFADSNGDGFGDFRGLMQHVGYLAELGVTCIWLLPFFLSPRRDDGYDIADHYRIDPRFGTLDDFLAFRHAAGEHGIRVIVDLVVNHTSDQHHWFEAARRDERSRYRDYYVWAASPPPTPKEPRPIFPGQVDTVWTYDEVARAYYFHRFYPFEPGLNGANDAVRREIERVIDFWLALGVDGFRMDAASHLIEPKVIPSARPEDGRAVLRELYDYMKARRPEAIILAEADVEPAQVEQYFSTGDQVSLLLNFIIDNWLVYALAMQRAEPVLEGLRRMARPPASGGWANFLRNLDELDLERLPDDRREELMRRFAPEEAMRIFGRGVRRRLAPMLGGDRRRIECAMSVLFSLPGTPTLVYGDEIGLGEDLTQPGRWAVRVPMQWNGERNGGFSTAEADELVQPVLHQGPYGYQELNVESQRANASSLWHAVVRLARLRREHPAIGEFVCRPVETGHRAVLGLAHDTGRGLLAALNNLGGETARFSPVLPLRGPVEATDLLRGGTVTLEPGAEVELEPYGYRWLKIDWPA